MSAAPPALWVLDDGRIMGGGQRTTLGLALASGERARVVCPAGSELARACREHGVAVVDASFPDPDPRAAAAVPGAVARLRHVLPPGATVVAAGARAGLWAALALATRRRPRPRLVHLMLEQDSAARGPLAAFLRRQGAVVALGANAAGAYERALGAAVERANNFLPPERMAALVAARRAGRADGAPVVGALGRMIPAKGLLELVGELAAARPSWSVARIGAEPEDAAYESRVRERAGAGIELLGAVRDLPAFFASIDVLVVPSTGNEGQPGVIVEALAAGVPVVVRRPVWSQDYDGLPVVPYDGAGDLAARLGRLPGVAVAPDELAERFGPAQLLAAVERAAQRSAQRRVVPL
jgi:glycosyltransferase involved in cell wall biosynthesis